MARPGGVAPCRRPCGTPPCGLRDMLRVILRAVISNAVRDLLSSGSSRNRRKAGASGKPSCGAGPVSPQVAPRYPLGCDDTGPAPEGWSVGRQKRPLTPRSGCFPASARGPRSACRSSCRPGGYRAETRRGDRQGRNSTSLTAFEMTAMGVGAGTTSGGRREFRRTACPATAPLPRRARRWRCRTPRSRSRPRSSTAASATRRARAARARRPAASPRTGSW